MSTSSPVARWLFGGLAVLDAAALAYLVQKYGWLNFAVAGNVESPAAIIVIPLLWAVSIGEKLFFAAFFALIGAGIVRELAATREPPRWGAVVASIVLITALAGIAMAWFRIASPLIDGPPGFFVDRLTFFDAAARSSHGGRGMFGASQYAAGSIGALLVAMLLAVYLAEKYLLAWWRVRWPIPLLPLLAFGWGAWSVHRGEQAQRDWVAAQQWRPVAEALSWLDAVGACEGLGPGWRLPRRAELTHYLATQPPGIQSWKGAAWTSSSADGGSRAIAVDLTPRKSGRWDRASEPLRDESPCETRELPGYAHDWVAGLRRDVCDHTAQSPRLYTPGLKLLTHQRGNVQFELPTAATICIGPATPEMALGGMQGRGYPQEKEFTRVADFSAYMAQHCRTSPNANPIACFAFAPDLPPFDEDGDERTMRTFCDLAYDGEGCFRYAQLMDRHAGSAQRAEHYRELACKRGYRPACGKQ